MLNVKQVFGNNVGARLAYEHDSAAWTDGLTVAPAAVESWFQERQNYPEPEAVLTSEKSADIFWRGTSRVSYKGDPYYATRTEKIVLSNGAALYKGWYRDSITWTLWQGTQRNYRFVVSIERGNVITRCWCNVKQANGRWRGTVVNEYNHGDWQLPSAERLSTAWVIVGVDAILSGDIS